MNRETIIEFGKVALNGRKHCNNHRLKTVITEMENNWPYIYAHLGALVCLWSYLNKHLFSKFALTIKLGDLHKEADRIEKRVKRSLDKPNPLLELTEIGQDLFADHNFTESFMEAWDSGTYAGVDLNREYEPMKTYINRCLHKIHRKLVRDTSVAPSQHDDKTTTASNQYAESFFAQLKRNNESLQQTATDGRFQDRVSFRFNNTIKWLEDKPIVDRNKLVEQALKERNQNRSLCVEEGNKEDHERFMHQLSSIQ